MPTGGRSWSGRLPKRRCSRCLAVRPAGQSGARYPGERLKSLGTSFSWIGSDATLRCCCGACHQTTAKRQAAVRWRWIWRGHSTRASSSRGLPGRNPSAIAFCNGPCCVSNGRGGGVVWRHSRFTSSPFRVLLLLMLRPWHTFLMIPTHVLTLMRTLSRT